MAKPKLIEALKVYRDKAGLTVRALAEECTKRSPEPIADSTLLRIEKRQRVPSHGLMCILYDVTGGAVAPNDFLPPDLVAKVARRKAKAA